MEEKVSLYVKNLGQNKHKICMKDTFILQNSSYIQDSVSALHNRYVYFPKNDSLILINSTAKPFSIIDLTKNA